MKHVQGSEGNQPPSPSKAPSPEQLANFTSILRAGAAVDGSDQSFQANILLVNDGTEVAKVYDRINLFGLIDLADENQRRVLMEREVTCLNALSESVGARIESILTPSGEVVPAIIMKRFPASEFLFRRLAANEELAPQHIEKLGDAICTFHFNSTSCPVEPIQVSDLFEQLLSTERGLLSPLVSDDPIAQQSVERWFSTMEQLVSDNKPKFDVAGTYLGEPVLGHGDLKSLNMVFSENGDVHVLDVAPYRLWQINARRMDAMFFNAEMKVIGREQEAKVFFNRYDSEYTRRQESLGRRYDSSDVVGEAIQKMDVLSEFYRYIIFYRLTFLGVDPERSTRCEQLLNETVHRAENLLNNPNTR